MIISDDEFLEMSDGEESQGTAKKSRIISEEEFQGMISQDDSASFTDYLRAVPATAVDIIAGSTEGLASALGEFTGDYELARNIGEIRTDINDVIMGDAPETVKGDFAYKLASGLGSTIPYLGAALVARRPSMLSKVGANAFFLSSAGQQVRDDYLATQGVTSETATDEQMSESVRAGAIGAVPIALAEKLGAGAILKPFTKGAIPAGKVMERISQYAAAGAGEAATEVMQSGIINSIASYVSKYDEDRPITRGMAESALIGFLVGGGVNAGIDTVDRALTQSDRMRAGVQDGSLNANDVIDPDVGSQMAAIAMENGSVPEVDSDQQARLTDKNGVSNFISKTLTPLSRRLGRAGREVVREFRKFEMDTGVKINDFKEAVSPFSKRMLELKKSSPEDYKILSRALANANELSESLPDSVQRDLEKKAQIQPELVRSSSEQLLDIANPNAQIINQQVDQAKQAIEKAGLKTKVHIIDSGNSYYDPSSDTIAISATQADGSTVAHELVHVVFSRKAKTDIELQAITRDMFDSVIRSTTDGESLNSQLKEFVSQYDTNIQNEEFLAQAVGELSRQYASLDLNTKTRIKVWVNQVMQYLGMDGVFKQAQTDSEVIDQLNAISRFSINPESITDIESSSQSRMQKGKKVDVNTFIGNTVFLRNSKKFKDKLKNGEIKVNVPNSQFEGNQIFLHSPDYAMSGTMRLEGETVVKGKGGVYYPVLFSDTNEFWASTRDAAKDMAVRLNKVGDANGGKILMGLVSAPPNKLFSSTTMSTGTINFFNVISKNPKKYGLSKEALNEILFNASKVTDASGRGFAVTNKKGKEVDILKNSSSLDINIKKMSSALSEDKSTFPLRHKFVDSLIEGVAKHYGKVSTEHSRALAVALLGKNNQSAKRSIKEGKISTANIKQALGEQFGEQFTKGLYDVGAGKVYAIIEYDGKVEAVKSKKHESYGYTIRGVDGGKVTVNIMDQARSWFDIVEFSKDEEFRDSKTNALISTAMKGDRVDADQVLRVMPTTSGVSFRSLKIVKPVKGSASSPITSYQLSKDEGAENIAPVKFSKERRERTATEEEIIRGLSDDGMRLLEKHGMVEDYRSVRETLNKIKDEYKGLGLDANFIENYFPRLVQDLKGLKESYGQKTGIVDQEIRRYEKMTGQKLSESEIQVMYEKLARSRMYRGGASSPSNMKERRPELLKEPQMQYYADPEVALDNYIEKMVNAIETKKLIGDAASGKTEGSDAVAGRLGEVMKKMADEGRLRDDQIEVIQGAVQARFGQHGSQYGFVKGAKNMGYLATMGNVGSTLTQLGDFYFTMVQNGLIPTIEAVMGKKNITVEDLGIAKDMVEIDSKQGAGMFSNSVKTVFKWTGLTAMDRLAKNTNINAAHGTLTKGAKASQNSNKYKKTLARLKRTQGNDAYKTIADLQNGVKSDLVLEALYNELSDVAPISLTEMPEAYAGNPNLRIMYSLKSYTIKQFNFVRERVFSKMYQGIATKNPKMMGEASADAMKILAFSTLANGSADVLKNIIFNREIDEEDLFWNNLLRIFGVSKYTTVQIRKEGLDTAILKTIAPPQLGVAATAFKDAQEMGEVSDMRSLKYMPFVGKLYYWREGRGSGVEERLSRLRETKIYPDSSPLSDVESPRSRGLL